MTSRGQTDFKVSSRDLVPTIDREHCRPDQDIRRNFITSIYWVPTLKSPQLALGVNYSDHVRYYQGGQPFQYILWDRITKTMDKPILGPDIKNGHKLQIPVRGGTWKCGHLIQKTTTSNAEYTIVGGAVAPGI